MERLGGCEFPVVIPVSYPLYDHIDHRVQGNREGTVDVVGGGIAVGGRDHSVRTFGITQSYIMFLIQNQIFVSKREAT